jgi:hypothetical protein
MNFLSYSRKVIVAGVYRSKKFDDVGSLPGVAAAAIIL